MIQLKYFQLNKYILVTHYLFELFLRIFLSDDINSTLSVFIYQNDKNKKLFSTATSVLSTNPTNTSVESVYDVRWLCLHGKADGRPWPATV